MKPYSEACDENKQPILAILLRVFADSRRVLEIGSGTGQHAVYFGAALQHLIWQTSDRGENHVGILAWLDEAGLPNVRTPLLLDVAGEWPEERFDAVFSANTAHIMSWPEVEQMFQGVGRVLEPNGRFALYGPFNFGGTYTSESNARFDQMLKARDPHSGLRNFEELDVLANNNGLSFSEDVPMPVNNRTLVWRKA
ncbi:MAG: DUF938 domain-containing protein [Gammaproteobacteria bacterium]|nr:DUF938 domain-containing protein [Gammaproteobacteria bacterium]